MKNLIIIAALAFSASAADIVVVPQEQRNADFVMEFDAQFAKNASRHLDLHLFFPDFRYEPTEDPARWRYTKTGFGFDATWTRTLGDIGSGFTGTPFMNKGYFKPFAVPDDTPRHVKVVSDSGALSFYLQFGDEMVRARS